MWWTVAAFALLAGNAGFMLGRARRAEEREALTRLTTSINRLADAFSIEIECVEDGAPVNECVVAARGLH